MITYTYDIKRLTTQTVDGIDNVVTHIHLDYVGTDENGNKAYCQAVIPFNVKEIVSQDSARKREIRSPAHFDPNNYTPFDNLTQEQVESWIDEHLPDSAVTIYEQIITEKLAKMGANNSSYLPWTKT